MSPDEWMDADQAAAYLKRTPKTLRNIVATGEIPRHYLTERGILFSRKELDEWLMSR
jgi:excisionase family DNA binding protein